MKATREQCLAMAREIYGYLYLDKYQARNIERLVHLAQKFERDRLRANGAVVKSIQGDIPDLYRIEEEEA